ncbi:hypothetical protein T12_10408 [Trichinella patagoniensis]|uniref:Uncharacterized protein n=1 Tax=Trichinella patagoniensis TaxID=990121 RepID=A0A0V0ZBM5_9BILA|nr:hypothetical protein T12_10408 [Trichinella patagoniensis]
MDSNVSYRCGGNIYRFSYVVYQYLTVPPQYYLHVIITVSVTCNLLSSNENYLCGVGGLETHLWCIDWLAFTR